MGDPQQPSAATDQVGRDRVLREGDRLVIEAAAELDRWEISPHRPTVVHYRGELFVLVDAETGQDSRVRYLLDRVDTPPPNAGYRFDYDADLVLQRDINRSLTRAEGGLRALFWLARPLIGLLPSTVKVRLLMRIGVHPIEATQASLLPVYLYGIVTTLVVIIGLFTGFFPWSVVGKLIAVAALLAPDALIRQSRINMGGVRQYGFYEWLFRRIRPEERAPPWLSRKL